MSFPEGFLWGAAISHFQVEGHPEETSRRLSDWSNFTTEEGRIADGSSADRACEFYSRFDEDIAICRNMNMNTFRLSLNWPLLAGDDGSDISKSPYWQYYRKQLTTLKDSGMKTFVTLFHFTLPNWLAKEGGWLSPRALSEFKKLTSEAVNQLGDLVDFWITINEPLAYTYQGYVSGVWPPGQKNEYLTAFQCIRALLEAHGQAYDVIHDKYKNAMVSVCLHWRPFMPHNPLNPLDHFVSNMRDFVFNHSFPLAIKTGELKFPFPLSVNPHVQQISGPIPGIKGKFDYLAINYYTRQVSEFSYSWPLNPFGKDADSKPLTKSGIGWEVYPVGLFDTLTIYAEPYTKDPDGEPIPVYITENGFATKYDASEDQGDWSLDDRMRVDYLLSHLRMLLRAIRKGVDVRGYLHWSLLDNFEWADGLSARFGLVRISYPSQKRTPRLSAQVYGEIARRNALPDPSYRPVYDAVK